MSIKSQPSSVTRSKWCILNALFIVGMITAISVAGDYPAENNDNMGAEDMPNNSGSDIGSGGMQNNPGWMPGDSNSGVMGSMMGDMMNQMMGMMSQSMTTGNMMINSNSPFYIAPPVLTLDEVFDVLNAYLADLKDDNLEAHDVMIFDNHAYAQITEKDSHIGALEVLIDPETKAVYPEMGPNMMWNLEYGMMSGFGGYGMMSGGAGMMGSGPGMQSNTLTPEQAVVKAQAYLDEHFSAADLEADEHADPFYGYYTLHVKHDGKTVGMLSVNSFSGQVWPHTWHGKLLIMSE